MMGPEPQRKGDLSGECKLCLSSTRQAAQPLLQFGELIVLTVNVLFLKLDQIL